MYKKHIHLARKHKPSYLLSRTLPSPKEKKNEKTTSTIFPIIFENSNISFYMHIDKEFECD